jgi:hypothetical protein
MTSSEVQSVDDSADPVRTVLAAVSGGAAVLACIVLGTGKYTYFSMPIPNTG